MSKFKVGDIVSPNVDYIWANDWQESEVVGFDVLGPRIKNKDGIEGRIAVEERWDVVESKKEDEMPKIEVGSKWTDTVLPDYQFLAKVVHVSNGDVPHVFYEFEDGSGCAQEVVLFLKEYKPFVEKKTITRWTYVYRDMDSDELEIDGEIFETEEDAIDDAKMVLCRELIKTLKIEYTEE